MAQEAQLLEIAGREVRITSPDKVIFPELGLTKLDLIGYYTAVEEAMCRHVGERPTTLKRWPEGSGGKFFFQKRLPKNAPEWLERIEITSQAGIPATELVANDAAHLAWAVNLGVIDFNPWPARRDDLDHADQLRIDLDPVDGVAWDDVRKVALVVRELLEEHGLEGYPKTSGSRGMHVYVPIERRYDYFALRRAALAVAREVERRTPLASSKWWKEERHGVFLDFNQNLRDRTIASVYSVRPVPDARVACPLHWSEVPDVEAADLTVTTVPVRVREQGDAWADFGERPGSLDSLLELAARDAEAGIPDAPYPPHYAKQPGEPPRVAPSRARRK